MIHMTHYYKTQVVESQHLTDQVTIFGLSSNTRSEIVICDILRILIVHVISLIVIVSG